MIPVHPEARLAGPFTSRLVSAVPAPIAPLKLIEEEVALRVKELAPLMAEKD